MLDCRFEFALHICRLILEEIQYLVRQVDWSENHGHTVVTLHLVTHLHTFWRGQGAASRQVLQRTVKTLHRTS